MFYKAFTGIVALSIGVFFYLLSGTINKSIIINHILLYSALCINAVHCYQVEKGTAKFMWPASIFSNMFTNGPVLLFMKGGTLLFASGMLIHQILLVMK